MVLAGHACGDTAHGISRQGFGVCDSVGVSLFERGGLSAADFRRGAEDVAEGSATP